MTIVYVASRYDEEIRFEYEHADEALEHGFGDIEHNSAFPLDIFEDDRLLWTNRGGNPLRNGTTPLTDKIYEWAARTGRAGA